ncbi:uncharacterized protein [Penaeus vannamei]|uniref:uncharacterized protein isoform X2 n=1 Tax=Penaeus vannamei TaxID=6689 RepID=UPI00387F7E92
MVYAKIRMQGRPSQESRRCLFTCCACATTIMYVLHLHLQEKSFTRQLTLTSSAVTSSPPMLQQNRHNSSRVVNLLKDHLDSVPTSCACALAPLSHEELYNEYLSQPVSWMNLSTRQVLEKQHPNFPVDLLSSVGGGWCNLLPSPIDIEWHNTYYQSLRVSENTSYLLYSAILDNRILTDTRPCIRVLAYSKDIDPDSPWCYIWFNSTGPPAISPVLVIDYIDYVPGSKSRQMVYILTCRIPKKYSHLKPLAVSLVRRPCERALTLLQVVGSMERNASTAFAEGGLNPRSIRPPQWNVAVCGPALFYYHQDISVRLVEWLELLRASGFAKVFLSETDVHPNIQKVLQYYVQEGFVSVTKFTYPEPYVNEPNTRRLWTLLKQREMFSMENMYFTDCALRHMHEYRFISHFDPDEMPVLLNHETFPRWVADWTYRHEVTAGKKNDPWKSLHLAWYYHNDDLETPSASLPKYMWMLRHSRRSLKKFAVNYGTSKPVFNMDVALGVNSHMLMACSFGNCHGKSYVIPRREAYVAHFKQTCGDYCKRANATREEPALLRHEAKVIPAVTRVLQKLQLI